MQDLDYFISYCFKTLSEKRSENVIFLSSERKRQKGK